MVYLSVVFFVQRKPFYRRSVACQTNEITLNAFELMCARVNVFPESVIILLSSCIIYKKKVVESY